MRSLNSFAALRSARQAQLEGQSSPSVQSSLYPTYRQYSSLSTPYEIRSLFSHQATIGAQVNQIIGGTLDSSNTVDYFRFGLFRPASLDVSLTGLTGNANVRLIRDANGNGRIDPGDTIIGSYNPSNVSEAFQANGLGIGSYFLEVANVNNAQTPYSLSLTAEVGAPREPAGVTGNSPREAIVISGQLNGDRTFMGSVNSSTDMNDYYRFTLDQAVKFETRLQPLNSNANLYLYVDTNQNGTLEPEELIGFSANQGTTRDKISKEVLTPGDYYVQVQKPVNSGNTEYQLDLTTWPLFKNSRVTVDIHHLKALEQFDSKVPWTNWHQADFKGDVWIDGKQQTFGTFKDQDVITGLKFTEMVDPNKRFIHIGIYAYDEDFATKDYVDLSPTTDKRSIQLTYDTVKQQVISFSDTFSGVRREGDNITLSGNLNNPKDGLFNTYAAEISFSVNYDPIL